MLRSGASFRCGGARILTLLMGLGALAGCQATGAKSGHSGGPEGKAVQPTKDPRALQALKAMSDKLTAAKTLTFKTRNMISVALPTGQWIRLFGNSTVVLERPDKLFADTAGDQAEHDFYYDGRTMTMYAPGANAYAQEPVSGSIDAMINRSYEIAENYFPFADVLMSNPYEALTRNLTSATLVGQSQIGGVLTDHLAFAGEGIEWEIWNGTEDKLPRLLLVTYLNVDGRPLHGVEFSNWTLGATIPAATFTFQPPAGAVKIEFSPPSKHGKNKKP